jgi:hypothetical protein
VLNRAKPLKCFPAVVFDVGVQHFKLRSNVLDGAGQPDHSITRFITFTGKPHGTHGGNRNAGASHCGNDFNHDGSDYKAILATLTAQEFPAVTRFATSTVTLTGGFFYGILADSAG